jgi:hypothetical protein
MAADSRAATRAGAARRRRVWAAARRAGWKGVLVTSQLGAAGAPQHRPPLTTQGDRTPS